MRRQRRLPSRPGFTLVELMVAMALIIFIMYILAEAFSAGSKTFRDLKAIGDMNSRLRSATATLRRLLAANHFEGNKRLSDYNFWTDEKGDPSPPKMGFFRIWQDNGGRDEGADLDGNHSYTTEQMPNIGDPTGHHLHFTVRFRGNNRSDFFRATVPPGSPLLSLPNPDSRYQDPGSNEFTSRWAEIALFLRPSGDDTGEEKDNPLDRRRLYTLFMRQRLLVPANRDVQDNASPGPPPAWPVPVAQANQYLEVSQTTDPVNTGQLYFNSPEDVTMPARRFNNPSAQTSHPVYPSQFRRMIDEPNSGMEGSDVVLTDIVAFDVRVLLDSQAYTGGSPEDFISLWSNLLEPYRMREAAAPNRLLNNQIPDTVRVFDTWTSRKDDAYDYTLWRDRGQAPSDIAIPIYQNDQSFRPIRIRAIQITIRIYDSRTRQSRQVSIVQDM